MGVVVGPHDVGGIGCLVDAREGCYDVPDTPTLIFHVQPWNAVKSVEKICSRRCIVRVIPVSRCETLQMSHGVVDLRLADLRNQRSKDYYNFPEYNLTEDR